MKNFLIRNEAVVGRTKKDGADLPPMELVFYTMVKAETHEQASDMAVQYADRGFQTKVTNIVEVGDEISGEELYKLLKQEDVVKAMY